MKMPQCLSTACILAVLATAATAAESNLETTDVFIGYFYPDLDYKGNYYPLAPAVLNTCYKLPDWFIYPNGVTSIQVTYPGSFKCDFFENVNCDLTTGARVLDVSNSISDLRSVGMDNLVVSYTCRRA